MKKAVLFSAMGVLASVSSLASAEELGRVISTTPVIQQVAVPRQVCSQPYAVQQPNSGGGAIVGAIVGGLLGNTIGHGMGRAAATGVGVIAGAAVGDNIEGRNQPQAMQQCSTQTYYENRTTAYNVQYEYAGKQYSVQLPYDPGSTIRLQLSPIGAGAPGPAAATVPSGPGPAQPVIVAPPLGQTVDGTQPAQAGPSGQAVATIVGVPTQAAYPVGYAPAYYAPAYYAPVYAPSYGSYYRAPYFYPPIGLSLSFGYSGGWGGHRHHRR